MEYTPSPGSIRVGAIFPSTKEATKEHKAVKKPIEHVRQRLRLAIWLTIDRHDASRTLTKPSVEQVPLRSD